MFKFIAVLLTFLSLQAPTPEIIAKPVPFVSSDVQTHFKAPLWNKGSGHRGIDLALEPYQAIASPFDGEVFFNGKVVDRQVVTLVSESGLKASFEPVCGTLAAGARIRQGQAIGFLCEGELSYQSHCLSCVHFSIRNSHGYLNPLLFYGLLTPPVLKS